MSQTFFSFGRFRGLAAFLVLICLPLAVAAQGRAGRAAEEKSYVLLAAHWTARQTRAVLRAGGQVSFSHDSTGIGIATSTAPRFLKSALASRAFVGGAEDQVVQWQMPTRTVPFSSDITPGDETFFPLQWNMLSINAPDAWSLGATGNGVRVAILDGGIDDTHPDLAPNLDFGASTSFIPGMNFNEDTGTGAGGFFWHGTHVAGIVAAADNGLGVIGVAPRATLIGVKVLDGGVGSFGATIQGILYATTVANADIINMSLGAVFPKTALCRALEVECRQLRGDNAGVALLVAVLNQVVAFAESNGTLVIVAAGNDEFNFDHSRNFTVIPAESSTAVAVSATGPVDFASGGTNFRRFASYSNSGHSLVDVAAPGGDFTLFPNGAWFLDMVISTTKNGWAFAAGTSMAAPAASGVAALLKERFPNASVGKLKTLLANTADDEGKRGNDAEYGKGFVNALRAVTQ